MRTWLVLAFIAAFALAIVSGEPSGWGGYFQYANVPGWGQYEFGYNRGNHDHFTSRFEQGWGWKFKTKVRWGDKKGGYGEMYYDYQHSPKKGWGHGHSHGHGKHHHGSYSELVPTVLKPSSGPLGIQALGSNPQPIVAPVVSSIPQPQSSFVFPQQATPLQRLSSRNLGIERRMGRVNNNYNPYYNPYNQMRY